jgi:hypothetical protein
MAASGWLHWLRVRENLSLVVSGAALVVAVVGTAVSCMAADSARDQAQSAREQADVAKEAFDNESSAQSRRINLNPDGLRHVLVLQNTSTLPIRGIRVYAAEGGEPRVQYASRDELAGCTLIRLDVRETDPRSLLVVFTDAMGAQWITDGDGRMEKTGPGAFDVPERRQRWEFDLEDVTACS